jgi:hypothetical protein
VAPHNSTAGTMLLFNNSTRNAKEKLNFTIMKTSVSAV